MSNNTEDDEPLDPVLENIRRKMQRLMLISFGIMGFGLMALIAVIVYKLSVSKPQKDEVTAAQNVGILVQSAIKLPSGANIVDTQLNDNHILITIRQNNGDHALWTINATTGQVISQIQLNK